MTNTELIRQEIERQKKHLSESYLDERGAIIAYDTILSFIDSLQQEQPEVDLEKEIIRFQREDMDRDTTVGDVARHFYQLGFNARKEKQYETICKNRPKSAV